MHAASYSSTPFRDLRDSLSIHVAVLSRAQAAFRVLAILVIGAALATLGPAATAQQPGGAAAAQQTHVDVGILVSPSGPDSANIGIAYSGRVDHRRVREEIARFSKAGWQVVGPVTIRDETIHADDQARFPKLTEAEFAVAGAALVTQRGPELRPYLQAFQKWHTIEVILAIPRGSSSGPVTHFESGAVSVDMVTDDRFYRFDATIKDHTGPLPEPEMSAAIVTSAKPVSTAMPAGGHTDNSRLWTVLLAVAGSGLICSGALMLILRRQVARTAASVTNR